MDTPAETPRYRLLTGPDDAAFCQRVSEALEQGYQLYGSPAITHDGTRTVVAQAVVWPGQDTPAVPQASRPGFGFGFGSRGM